MNRIFNGRMGVLQVRIGIVSEWLSGQIDPGAVAEIALASIIAKRTRTLKVFDTTALNLSAREPRPMKAFAFKDNHLILHEWGGHSRSPRFMPKVREAIRLVERDGWRLVRTRGSHRIYKHRHRHGTVVIPGHPSRDLPKGLWHNILRQAGLKERRQ